MSAHMLYLYALSPTHIGSGDSTGIIDLPVSREAVTGWPDVPGSAIKGVLRDACDPDDDGHADYQAFKTAFGPPIDNPSDNAGNLWFTDARLLCLPVQSWAGSFAWVSCPTVLRRWVRDHETAVITPPLALGDIPAPSMDGVLTAPGNAGVAGAPLVLVNDHKVCLADLDLARTGDAQAAAIAGKIAEAAVAPDWKDHFIARFGIVSDDVFSFLAGTLAVTARIRLDDNTKTVARGALWYEENVPAESIFSCPLIAAPRPNGATSDEMFALVNDKLGAPLQIGGNASIGRGLVRFRLSPSLKKVKA